MSRPLKMSALQVFILNIHIQSSHLALGSFPNFLAESRPLNVCAHARQRLSLPPTLQPPTSSPCVWPASRQTGRGFKFLQKSFHQQEFPEFRLSFNEIL